MSTAAPSWAFVLRHPAHLLGLGLGSGLVPVAPGTAGTLCGWLLFALLQWAGAPWALLCAWALLAVPVGWWACTVSARNLRWPDPGCVVWDEMTAIWWVLCALGWMLPPSASALEQFLWQSAGFAVFRFFDAAKPQPVRWADKAFKGLGWRGGWGIMFDDLVAAACTVATLAVAAAVL